MKKILSMLSVLTLAGTSVGSVGLSNNTKINNLTNNQETALKEIAIEAPREVLLTTAGDFWKQRQEWDYATINLGQLRQEQIIDIVSTNNDSYTEHKVEDYGYYKRSYEGGINSGDFRKVFHQGGVNSDWDFNRALSGSYTNFRSSTSKGLVTHNLTATIKFKWYYDDNNDLLVDIVGTVRIYINGFSTVKSIGSIKLGSLFTVKYLD